MMKMFVPAELTGDINCPGDCGWLLNLYDDGKESYLECPSGDCVFAGHRFDVPTVLLCVHPPKPKKQRKKKKSGP